MQIEVLLFASVRPPLLVRTVGLVASRCEGALEQPKMSVRLLYLLDVIPRYRKELFTMSNSPAATATTVWFNKTVVAQAVVLAPKMKFTLYAQFAVREKLASDLAERGLNP
ncbi:MAG: hypothetical protein JNM66_24970 [Bryobacterales bacterium]|nr:hypothetical protein [Bryobacterales bacterium]